MRAAKLQFRRFEGFYKAGTLEDNFVKKLKDKYEQEESGIIESWFEYCKEKHGEIEQVSGGTVDILEK